MSSQKTPRLEFRSVELRSKIALVLALVLGVAVLTAPAFTQRKAATSKISE
jgi:hypothetical protein